MNKLLIVFNGVDGAGKTTHSFLLSNVLRTRFSTSLVHDGLPTLITPLITLVIQRRGSSWGDGHYDERGQNVNNKTLRQILRVFLYAFNEILILIRILKTLKNCDMIILDRWFPCVFASIVYSRKGSIRLIMMFLNILSKISGIIINILNIQVVIILLRVDPMIAHLRRPEHSLIRQKVVSTFTEYFSSITAKKNRWIFNAIDTTNKSVQEVHLMILKALLKTINRR